MRKEAKSQLDSLMDAYDQKVGAEEKRQERIQSEEEKLTGEFLRLRTETILPVMKEVKAHLEDRGHKVNIFEQDESVGYKGKTSPARITIEILPKGVERKTSTDSVPSVSFSASKSEKRIYVHECTIGPRKGGHAGSRGKFEIKDIDAGVVENEILCVLKEIFSK